MDDSISRQAAINMIMGQPPEPHYPSWYAEQIRGLPPTEPKRKIGRWIRKKNVFGVAYCSECNYELRTNDTNYCPECGAYMRWASIQSECKNEIGQCKYCKYWEDFWVVEQCSLDHHAASGNDYCRFTDRKDGEV